MVEKNNVPPVSDVSGTANPLEESLRQLKHYEELYQIAAENSSEIIVEYDVLDKSIYHVTKRIQTLYGLPQRVENGAQYIINVGVVQPESADVFIELFQKIDNGEPKVTCTIKTRSACGDIIWATLSLTTIYDADQKPIRAIGVLRDISESRLKELALQENAEQDLLTGLYNKITAELLIKGAIAANQFPHRINAFIIMDLDNFKRINDNLGHTFGNAVISETGHKLKVMFPENHNIIGRLGGDKFVLFLQNMPSLSAMQEKVKDICNIFNNPYTDTLNTRKVSSSVGVALFPTQGNTFSELYRMADTALYTTKGKNTYCFYDESLDLFLADTRENIETEQASNKVFSDNIVEYVFRILYESKDFERVVTAVLELVSNHFGFSHSYIYEVVEHEGRCQNTFEWHASNVSTFSSEFERLAGFNLENSKKRFGADNIYIMRTAIDLPVEIRDFPDLQGLHYCFQYALMDNGTFQGYVGFEQYISDAPLTPSIIAVLKGVSQILNVFLTEKRATLKRVETGIMLQSIADNINSLTYIVDPETFLLAFVSKNAVKFAPELAVGKYCYKAIRDKGAPCEDCPLVETLKKGKLTGEKELYIDNRDTWFNLYVSIIKLADDKNYGLINCYDITEIKKKFDLHALTIESFTSDSALYDSLCQSTDDYIYICDLQKNISFLPQTMVDEFNLPNSVISDFIPIWTTMIHKNEREEFSQVTQSLIEGKINTRFQEYRVLNKDGVWVWVRCRGYLKHDDEGNPTLFAGILTTLGKRSKIDPLSGLQNKYEFETCIQKHISHNGNGGAILLLGLDNFKNINNLYSWELGDQILHASGQKIQTLLPEHIQLYRLDGDKFGVFLTSTNQTDISYIFQNICTEFQSQQQHGAYRYYCTISGGCSIFGSSSPVFHSIFKQAEYALEFSKTEGKNRLSFYDAETMSSKERRLTIIERLRESVDRNCSDFALFYQPQIEIQSQIINSAEALLRWQCEEYGSVSPTEFIPLLEQTGLIHPVGQWVLQQAAITCKKWREINPNFTINVNLSFAQIQDENLVPFLAQLLKSVDIDPSALHLEITESCITSGSQLLTSPFQQFRNLGFKIEMDDFGTGYSSLEVLKNAPADVVKIDRAFVKDITKTHFDATFINFVVVLCHSVNIKVCLEGVETWEEYKLVEPMNLDLIQGFLFGKPVSQANFEARYLYNFINKNL